MYRSKVCVQEFLYFVPGLDIQPEQSDNDNPALKKAVADCETGLADCKTGQVISSHMLFFSINMNQWLSG